MLQDRYHHGDLRKALLDAACDQLERVGFERLSLRDLASAQSVSPGAPYRHFPNRRSLLAALATQTIHVLWDRMRQATLGRSAGAAQLRAVAHAYLEFARAHPQQFRLMFVSELLTDDQPRDPALVEVADAQYEWFKSIVAAACVARDENSVAAATIALWSALHGFALMRMGRRFKPFMTARLTDAELADAVVEAAIGMAPSIRLRGKAAAQRQSQTTRRVVNEHR
jgi:AcrR family transcriptional regulator